MQVAVCKHKISGKYFIYICDTGRDEGLFATPEAQIESLKLSQFWELEGQEEEYLIVNALVTEDQINRSREYGIKSSKIKEVFKPHQERFAQNMHRVYDLVKLYILLNTYPEDFVSSQPFLPDILRASVVFLHATLEDSLRTLAEELLPKANEKILDNVPLLDINAVGRPEKFLLGKLLKFAGLSVNDVILQSIQAYLRRISFNCVDDIARFLNDLGLKISKVDSTFPQLEELMKRRHIIVHRADRSEPIPVDGEVLLKIDVAEVKNWAEAVQFFHRDVIVNAVGPLLMKRGYIRTPTANSGNFDWIDQD